MGTFADRLRASMSASNMKAVELHELTGISKASISEYLSGNYEPKQRNIFKMAQALDVSPSYLMGVSDTPKINENIKRLRIEKGMTLADVGEKLGVRNATVQRYESGEIKNLEYETVVKLAEIFGVTPAALMGWKEFAASSPRTHKKGVRIPVLGSVAAGVPIEAVEDILDYEEIDEELARTGEFFALQIRGASMEPVLYEGDVVIVRKQSSASTGDIAIVLINGDEATVKKIRREPSGLMLIGYNAAVYEPHFYTNEDIERLPVQILGKVVEMRRKF
nr:MAG TPA: Repressor protein CI [Caudoviricetes sp.]